MPRPSPTPKQEWVDRNNASRAQAGIWVRNLLESLSYYDIMSRLPLIKASATMVLYGEVDRLRWDGEELLLNNIVNAQKVVLPGIGHIPQVEDPEGFLGALDAILGGLEHVIRRTDTTAADGDLAVSVLHSHLRVGGGRVPGK